MGRQNLASFGVPCQGQENGDLAGFLDFNRGDVGDVHRNIGGSSFERNEGIVRGAAHRLLEAGQQLIHLVVSDHVIRGRMAGKVNGDFHAGSFGVAALTGADFGFQTGLHLPVRRIVSSRVMGCKLRRFSYSFAVRFFGCAGDSDGEIMTAMSVKDKLAELVREENAEIEDSGWDEECWRYSAFRRKVRREDGLAGPGGRRTLAKHKPGQAGYIAVTYNV